MNCRKKLNNSEPNTESSFFKGVKVFIRKIFTPNISTETECRTVEKQSSAGIGTDNISDADIVSENNDAKEKEIKKLKDEIGYMKLEKEEIEEERDKFKEECIGLEKENKNLREELKQGKIGRSAGNSVEISIDGISEFFQNEIKDYILSMLKSKEAGISDDCERNKCILKKIIEKNEISDGSEKFMNEIKQATKEEDYAKSLIKFFNRHEISIKTAKNNHLKITIKSKERDYVLTAPLTPSDNKSNKNNTQDLMKKLLLKH